MGLAFRIFLLSVGSSWTFTANPYRSLMFGSGTPQAAANAFGVGVGTGVGVGAGEPGELGALEEPPQARRPDNRKRADSLRIRIYLMKNGNCTARPTTFEGTEKPTRPTRAGVR